MEKEKPPIFRVIERRGQAVMRMLANVQQTTIQPILAGVIATGSQVYTDEYDIYARLTQWGYKHLAVSHGKGEYARDEDGDGFYENQVNTMEGVWSLLRSWLRPQRGLSQEKLPLYLAYFEFKHNLRQRGKAIFESLVAQLVKPSTRNKL